VRLRLITKLTIGTSMVLVAIMLAFAWFNVSNLERVFLAEAVKDADYLSETILRTTHYQMLEDDRKRVYQMIEEIGAQKDIEHIRLINKDGLINFSTEGGESGQYLDKNAEACNMCHREDTPLTHASSMSRSRRFLDRDGRPVLGIAKGIYNQEACYTAPCHFHPREAKILGVLDTIVSLQGMQTQIALYRNEVVGLTFVLLLLLAGSLTLLTQKFVNRPLRLLVQHTTELAAGNLKQRMRLAPKDEFGELAQAFNHMAQNLEQAQAQLEDWGRSLEIKVEERSNELKQMQGRLIRSEKLASLGELVAGIAHEINNPLTGILMYASMLESDPRLDPELQGDLATIVRETDRCALIVRELLDFARESVPRKVVESVHQVMDKTLSLVQHQASFHDIRILRNYARNLPEILLDPNQIEQVFMNIVLNAGQAMASGGTLSIETGVDGEQRRIFIHIRDTGSGIAEENLGKIFDPFFTTKGTKGTGLGLAVSYGIVENHGGQLEVDSRLGEGTTFTVLLPLAPGEEAAAIPLPA
jgi:two-component system, NtrC family, sensor kinase